MEKKKLKLSISGSSKKTINNIELAKSHGKNSVIIEKKPKFGNKTSFQKNQTQTKNFKPKQNFKFKQDNFISPPKSNDFEKRILAEHLEPTFCENPASSPAVSHEVRPTSASADRRNGSVVDIYRVPDEVGPVAIGHVAL